MIAVGGNLRFVYGRDESDKMTTMTKKEGWGHLKFSQVKEPVPDGGADRAGGRRGREERRRGGKRREESRRLCWEGERRGEGSRRKWVEERKKEENSQLRLTWNKVANHKELAKLSPWYQADLAVPWR